MFFSIEFAIEKHILYRRVPEKLYGFHQLKKESIVKRFIAIAVPVTACALVVLAALAETPAPPAAEAPAEAAPAAVEEKPKIRTLQHKDRSYEWFLTVNPGIPEAGRVVELYVTAQKIADPPQPQFGARIPMANATIVANAGHENDLTTSVDYLLHPIGDPGNFGFHFTPGRKGYFNVVFTGEFEGEKFDIKFRVPVDIWPLPASDTGSEVKRGAAERDAFGFAAQRRFAQGPAAAVKAPARKGPVMPGATGQTQSGVKVGELMTRMGNPWAELGDELFVKPRPNDKTAEATLDELYTIARMLQNSTPTNFPADTSEYQQYMTELQQALGRLNSEYRKQKYDDARLHFKMVEKDSCMRCHVKFRWKIVNNLSGYPNNLPGR